MAERMNPLLADRRAMFGTTLLMTIALAALVVLVALSPHRSVFDEPYYVNYVSLLHQYGFTRAFVESVPGPAGPLYGVVQFIAEPVTHLDPVRMRFVNVILLLGVALTLGAHLLRERQSDFWATPSLVLAVPMTWVLSGMALTESPALLAVTLSVYFLLGGLDARQAGRSVWWQFVASGASLGIAVWGRQPYLLLAGVVVLLAVLEPRLRAPALLFLGAVAAVVAPLIVAWHGLVPLPTRDVQGLSVSHGLLSLSYTGLCMVLVAPHIIRGSRAQWLCVAVLSVISYALWGATLYPILTLAHRILPARLLPAYGQLCGFLFVFAGVWFLASIAIALCNDRRDLGRVAVYSGLLCVSLSPLFVIHQYSSRYTAMALPFLILAARDWRRWQTGTVLLSGVGAGIGALSLWTYLYVERM